MFKRLFSAAFVFGAASTGPPAIAQLSCGPYEMISENLEQEYDETRFGAGLQSPTRLVELWVSDSSQTWTILVATPDGSACIIAGGKHWVQYTPDFEGARQESNARFD